MKYLAISFSLLCSFAYSCQNKNVEIGSDKGNGDNADMTGMYYSPTTGAKLFEIKRDSSGYYTKIPNNGTPSKRDSFRLTQFSELESRWRGFCGESYDLWMAEDVIGGKDWRPNFKGGVFNDRERFNFVYLKKGYVSKEHVYSTGYCFVSGSECFTSSISRVNIEKLN